MTCLKMHKLNCCCKNYILAAATYLQYVLIMMWPLQCVLIVMWPLQCVLICAGVNFVGGAQARLVLSELFVTNLLLFEHKQKTAH